MASLFDTGAFERLRREERQADSLAVRWYLPLICLHTAAEYFYGVAWAKAGETELHEAREAMRPFMILRPTLDTASIYARLRADARSVGRQMPDPDFWIAAHAIEERVPLVTTDRHFLFFEELNVHLLT